MRRYSEDEIKNVYSEVGLEFLACQTYQGISNTIYAYTQEGYIVKTVPNNIIRTRKIPKIFTAQNPYTIYNINVWLSKNAPDYVLLSNEYTEAKEDLVWKLKDSPLSNFNISWAKFKAGSRHPLLKNQRIANSKRMNPIEVRKQIQSHLNKNPLNTPNWNLIDNEEDKYTNIKSVLFFRDDFGYIGFSSLRTIKNGGIPQSYSVKHPELSMANFKLWMSINSKHQIQEGQIYRGNEEVYDFVCSKHGRFTSTIMNMKNNGGKVCRKCSIERISGENHYNWKGEERKETERLRGSLESKQWRKDVFNRDHYQCICCGSKQFISAHHKNSFEWCIDQRFNINNGVTLCEDCHLDFHEKFGFGNNTEEQFNKWFQKRINEEIKFPEQRNNRRLKNKKEIKHTDEKNITWEVNKQRWRVRIRRNGKINYLGYYRDIEDAIIVRDKFIMKEGDR